eukprot:CAMPEP_0114638552 /NCGR_PEP_ID=MMETSP0191-20121206/680_1 /TAXON_ID=126664 /ORGANISM="Sorites sp." /LENGTH=168 /DNA_ID=CAMNT_0001850325 /DNA_START=25 /DNA_END=531 /DNA_ORIENTATION=-
MAEEEKTEDVKAGLRKTAAGKGAEKAEKAEKVEKAKTSDKGEEKEEKKDAEPKPVTTVTFWQTFKGGVLSAPTLILTGAIVMNMFGKREEDAAPQGWGIYMAPIILLLSMAVGSALVTKMENSEWRQNLRAEVAAKEREQMEKKGVTQQDLNEAANSMGIQPTNFGQG